MIYVIGHKNPDTDSIVSALVAADFLKRTGNKSKAVRLGKMNKETEFVLNKAGIKPPFLLKSLAGKKVFLVDHNEIEQAGNGIEKAEILGILDHHKLGGMATRDPVYVRIEPIGSTSTLLFKLFQEEKFQIPELPKEVKGEEETKSLRLLKYQAFLLLAGILSDTLKLTSPTTTKEDKKAVQFLAKISQTDVNAFSEELFRIRSDISGTRTKDLIFSDYKEYKEKGLLFGVGVHETMNPKIVLAKEKDFFSALKTLKKEKKLNLIFFALVDILKKETHLFLSGEEEKRIAERAFRKRAKKLKLLLPLRRAKENLLLLPGVVSRKKQIIPSILKIL